MIEPTRRGVVGLLISGGLATLGLTAPVAHEQTTLDADIVVKSAIPDRTGDIGSLRIQITNTRPPDGDALTPVPHVWGVGRQTQMAWPPERGDYPSLAPGETAELFLSATGDEPSVRLKPAERAMIRVFELGNERRAEETFIPGDI
jgi:hypothetical protein